MMAHAQLSFSPSGDMLAVKVRTTRPDDADVT